ncbi:MAG: ABC transporter ATP-binding protein [Planctomycetota bacterium]
MIELRHLRRYFGETRAVDDVSFEVHAGEVFGYIGPNGAGKTTSMRVLSTLEQPTAGDAFVDGFSVVEDPDRVRQRLGFMPDAFGTYADVNCAEYLDFFARAYGLVGRERVAACRRVMDFTGLDELAQKPINGLSKGMKQRLCLGRALVHDPAVLILDEPAAGLDPRARIQLREMIAELATHGKAVLISSHILTELAEICDSVGIIERGQLLAVGSVAEMKQRLAQHTTIEIEFLRGVSEAHPWLCQRPHVEDCALPASPPSNGSLAETLTVEFHGDAEARAQLLRDLISAGHAVLDFRTRERNLEEVFLNVTEGRVQ